MLWLIVVIVGFVLTGALAWFYPQLRSQLGSRWREARFRALAHELGTDLEVGEGQAPEPGYMPTIRSVFGPYATVGLRLALTRDGEEVSLLDVRYGRRRSRLSYFRSATVVAFHLAHGVPRFTLQRPRGAPESRTTSFRIGRQPLVVQAVRSLELWSTQRARRRARKLVTGALLDALEADPGWDLRGVERWLIMFNRRRDRLSRTARLRYLCDESCRLRRLLGGDHGG